MSSEKRQIEMHERRSSGDISHFHFSAAVLPSFFSFIPILQGRHSGSHPDNPPASNNHNFINRSISPYRKEKINSRGEGYYPGTYQEERRFVCRTVKYVSVKKLIKKIKTI